MPGPSFRLLQVEPGSGYNTGLHRIMGPKGTASNEDPSLPFRIVLITAIASTCLAYLFFFGQTHYLCCDSKNYLDLSETIRREGVLGFSDPLRSYGYPLFVALSGGWAKNPKLLHFIVFNAQLAIFFMTCRFAAQEMGRIFRSRTCGVAALLLMALNPFLLIRTTELLTDSLSAVLVLLAVVLSWPTSSSPSSRSLVTRRCVLASLAAGFSVAVRPGNLVVLCAVLLVWIIRSRVVRDVPRRAFVLLAVSALVPLLPQLINNYREYGKVQPTVVSGLYSFQLRMGAANLKYGTVVSKEEIERLFYHNPFLAEPAKPDVAGTVVDSVRSDPVGYIATLATHGFAFVDQDFPFTYIADLTPWYRWPLSLLNYSFLYLAILGTAVMVRQLHRRALAPDCSVACISLLLAGGLYIVTHLPVLVENRFSAPIYLLATPCVLFAMNAATELFSKQRLRPLIAPACGALVFIVACVALSTWLQRQAPLLALRL